MSKDERSLAEDRLWQDGAILVVRSRNGTPADGATLRAWVGDNATRAAVVAQIEDSWTLAGQLRGHSEIKDMRKASALLIEGRRHRGGVLRWTAAAAAVGMALAIAIPAVVTRFPVTSPPVLVAVSQDSPRTFHLGDGSEVTLDARSRMEIRFSQDKREIRLTDGQARFAVAHNMTWPFHVVASNRDVRAVGTNFIVDARYGRLSVSLVQGRVDVSRIVMRDRWLGLSHTPTCVEPIPLSPGQQLVAVSGRGPILRRFSLEDVTAWQQGRLALDNLPLAEAVDAVNRYANVEVRLDPSVPGDLRVSGSFRSGDSAAFASNLVILYPELSLARENGKFIISLSKPQKYILH